MTCSIQILRRNRLFIDDLINDGRNALAGKRLLAGDHLVKHDAKPKKIRTSINRPAPHLLWRHVAWCPQDATGTGESRTCFRNTEIHDLHRLVRRNHDVGRLYVSMNDAFVVRIIKAGTNLLGISDNVFRGQSLALEHHGLERFTLYILHGDIEEAVDFVRIIDGDNVRMVQRSGSASLMAKSPRHLLVLNPMHVKAHRLERHQTADVRIRGFVDHSHRPAPKLGNDLIAAYLFRGHMAQPATSPFLT